ncbi:pentapeptide repeat-containing protein [Paractinoplanes lichenicola]|uniref:Pentapeptide repeat-containing protein n=1 Tax=Paractinoplanes lichenicola TaxID=2802976 RepID=A0ABS1VM27_9ACTN|nr:pentapeptide repeat-containing protein [Actinoplanes lichenicola]MBL7255775.1 pentapeptide repeat-containing protein [Actinoplanes lichenicola]
MADRPGLKIEAIKYGLGLFAASGAVAALLLALRRQRHLESAQTHTELDASERRFTDLYTKAVEQLGSDDAAVRLGGLYALERAAQHAVEAVFIGKTGFPGTIFDGEARFERATFEGAADFDGATFHGDAHFDETRFSDPPTFEGARAPEHGDRADVWPVGWRLEIDGSERARLIHD